MTAEILVLRLVHILGGIFWVGSGLFTTFFLVPALASSGPSAGPVMTALQRRHLFTALPVSALLTILSGLRLMWIGSAGFAPAYFASASGGTLAASGAAAIVAFLLALLVARPAAVRAARLGAARRLVRRYGGGGGAGGGGRRARRAAAARGDRHRRSGRAAPARRGGDGGRALPGVSGGAAVHATFSIRRPACCVSRVSTTSR